MVSNKFRKYMAQYEERNYAPKARIVSKDTLKKHRDRSSGKTCETGSSNSILSPEKEQEEVEVVMAKAKLGTGSRFKAVERSAAKSGASDPAAVAAVAGRKKFGEAKMEKMAKAGKKK